jgi:hypothetical protein
MKLIKDSEIKVQIETELKLNSIISLLLVHKGSIISIHCFFSSCLCNFILTENNSNIIAIDSIINTINLLNKRLYKENLSYLFFFF